jgi:imidazoleglycerol-phosphate dehydratase
MARSAPKSASRSASVVRKTKETDIAAAWDLDGGGATQVKTGIGFFDHMLEALAKHSGTAIRVRCQGDLHVDGHHTSEDVGIALGQCLRQALGDRAGIERFGHIACPLDEALVQATVDISGRPYLVYDLHPKAARIGEWDTELVTEFFGGLTDNARVCVHLHQLHGRNSHHIVEAGFKAFARALRQAIRVTGTGVPSTKGVLA